MAIVQLRHDTEGRRYYRRKLAAGKTPMEALRALKRRLSDVVYRQMLADAKRTRTGPGGHAGATLQSSAADPIPMIDTSDKSLPGPAEPHLKTTLMITTRHRGVPDPDADALGPRQTPDLLDAFAGAADP
jgi:transposase